MNDNNILIIDSNKDFGRDSLNPINTRDLNFGQDNLNKDNNFSKDKEYKEDVIIKNEENNISIDNIPKFIKFNFIDLNKVSKISKFRSGYGHDFSFGTDETCRSMKHYFWLDGEDYFWLEHHQQDISNETWPKVNYYAPIDGYIIDIRSNPDGYNNIESQLILKSKEYPNINLLFFHVRLDPKFKLNSEIKAGEKLGLTGVGSHAEIGVEFKDKNKTYLISYFRLLDDRVFNEYKKRGISLDNIIISKEDRDNDPLVCEDTEVGRFIGSKSISDKQEYDIWSMSEDNWVYLN